MGNYVKEALAKRREYDLELEKRLREKCKIRPIA